MSEVRDIVGVGFGPANLSLAVALDEEPTEASAVFLEAQREPVWQSGMLLAGSDIQNHPCRDLVFLRNPRSRYSFYNYLFEHGRLIEHLNLPLEFPLRKEYARYIQWVTRHFAHTAELGVRVEQITLTTAGGSPVYRVRTSDGGEVLGRSLVLGCGRSPLIPPPFADVRSPLIAHLTDYLPTVDRLTRPPRSVAVVGGSQSAVELVLDLSRRFPEASVVNYLRSYGPRSKDTSPFSEEGYFPAFTDYYYQANRSSKQLLDLTMRPTNYSAADQDVLEELYVRIYEQRLDGDPRIHVRGNREIESATAGPKAVELVTKEVHTGEAETARFDLVLLATGFRDLGPHEHQEPFPPLLADVIDRFRFDDDGYLAVNADYSLVPREAGTPPLFLNGLCESTHGIGDAGSFSLLSLRAATIREAVTRRLATSR